MMNIYITDYSPDNRDANPLRRSGRPGQVDDPS